MTTVQLVGAHRPHQQHTAGQVAVEEGEQVERRAIGPVQILGHDHRRATGFHLLDQGQQQLQESTRRRPRRHRLGLHGRLGEQELQFGGHPDRQLVELATVELMAEPPDGFDDGSHRNTPFAKLQATPDEHQEARAAGPADQFVDQTGLAHPRFTGDQQGGRFAPGGSSEVGVDRGQFGLPTDDLGSGHSTRHAPIMASPARSSTRHCVS